MGAKRRSAADYLMNMDDNIHEDVPSGLETHHISHPDHWNSFFSLLRHSACLSHTALPPTPGTRGLAQPCVWGHRDISVCVLCVASCVYMHVRDVDVCSLRVCLLGICAQPRYWLDMGHGAAAASPLLACQIQQLPNMCNMRSTQQAVQCAKETVNTFLLIIQEQVFRQNPIYWNDLSH